MTRDLLEKATKALSESGHEQQGARFTRERLMASLHERQRRHRSRFALVLPLAAIFVGSTAFAAVTGKLEVLVGSALDVVGYSKPAATESSAPPAPPVKPPRRAVAPSPVPVDSGEVEETAADGGSPEDGSVEPSVQDRHTKPQLSKPAVGRVVSETSDGHEVYRRAHRAQFQQGDCGAALRDYQQYLRENSGGRFALDAGYNRALCLVRVGRTGEAKDVLARFANGGHGGYRQADAQRLLAALADADAPAADD